MSIYFQNDVQPVEKSPSYSDSEGSGDYYDNDNDDNYDYYEGDWYVKMILDI